MSEKVATALNKVLSDYHVYYHKLRNYHWNVKGKAFFALHAKFEELYDEAAEHIDQVAERILTIGNKPLSNMSNYLETASLKEDHETTCACRMVSNLEHDLTHLVGALKNAAELADDEDDSGTEDLMKMLVSVHEKTIWMLKAFQEKEKSCS